MLPGARCAAIVLDGVEVEQVLARPPDGRADRLLLDVHVKGVQEQTEGGTVDRFNEPNALFDRIEEAGLVAVDDLKCEANAVFGRVCGRGAQILHGAIELLLFLSGIGQPQTPGCITDPTSDQIGVYAHSSINPEAQQRLPALMRFRVGDNKVARLALISRDNRGQPSPVQRGRGRGFVECSGGYIDDFDAAKAQFMRFFDRGNVVMPDSVGPHQRAHTQFHGLALLLPQ